MIAIGNEAVLIVPKITRKGQLLHILGVDDVPETVIAGQHFMQDKGRAVPIEPQHVQLLEKGVAKFYDLTAGRYGVTVDVGKSATTMREEGLGALGELIPSLPPPMAAALAPEYIAEMAFPGAQKLAEIARKTLPPGLQPQDGDGPNPQIMALQQQNQQLQQALESKVAEKQAEAQAKGQIELVKTDRDNATKVQIAQENNQTKFAIASLTAQIESINTALAAEQAERAAFHEAFKQHGIDVRSFMTDRAIQQADQAHELKMAAMDHAATLAQNDQAHQQALQQGDQGHQQALEQGQQAAALAPQPTNSGA
jgi:hypothetical protein